MRRVRFAARASRDLIEMWKYIAARNLDAADRLLMKIQDAAFLLAEFPGLGHVRADVSDPRYLFWTVRPYVLAYRHTRRTLHVVRVIHGARDFRRIFR